MSAARLSLELDADFVEVGEQRRADRRATDRRTPRIKLDPMFAATLVNHVARPETKRGGAYALASTRLRAGIVVNVRA